jgi:hypothetical protein
VAATKRPRNDISSPPTDPAGRIAFTLRVGVTGHRDIDDPTFVRAQVEAALDEAIALVTAPARRADAIDRRFAKNDGTRVRLVAVTSLAEGADRIVADAVIERAGSDARPGVLEVPLPFGEEEYLQDFDEPSRREFRRLLRFARVRHAPRRARTGDWRREGYEHAGRTVVDRCDVVLAVWNRDVSGGRGGTAEIVKYALEKRVPVVLVPTSSKHRLVIDDGTGRPSDSFDKAGAERPLADKRQDTPLFATRRRYASLARHNRGSGGSQFDEHMRVERSYLPTAGARGLGVPLDKIADWILPYFVRSDLNAVKAQRWHRFTVRMQMFGAVIALATVAIQYVRFPTYRQLAWIEAGMLLVILAVVSLEHLFFAHHDRWVSSRFLAERFRSAFFLAVVGIEQRREHDVDAVITIEDPAESWLGDAFNEVWELRPRVSLRASSAEPLRSLLVTAWLNGQVEYHRKQSALHESWLQRGIFASLGLFAITIVFAFIHAFVRSTLGEVPILIAIIVPAIAGAITGVAAHEQHRRHANAYKGMENLLQGIVHRLEELQRPTLGQIQQLAAQAADAMSGENTDWFGTMRLYDVEWHF